MLVAQEGSTAGTSYLLRMSRTSPALSGEFPLAIH